MAPLGDAAKAAHAALWSARHGGRVLGQERVQDKLIAYFAGRGEAVIDLPVDVDVNDKDSWRSEWKLIATSAGIDDDVDVARLVMWLEKRAAGPTGVKSTGVAAKALETLETHGVTLSPAVISDLEKNLALGEAGEAAAQCTSCLTVGILYLGTPFEPEDEDRWLRLHGALAPGGGGQIDVCRFPGYISLMSRSANLTMERALKSQVMWDQYYSETLDHLESNGVPKAARMLHNVVMQCARQAQSSEVKKRDFLRGYFFDEFRGIGMPALVGVRSSLAIMGEVPGARAVMPTTCTNYDLALSGFSAQSQLAAHGSTDLASLLGGSCAGGLGSGGSVAGSVTPSSAGGSSAQEFANAVVSLISQGGLGAQGAAALGAPPRLPQPPPPPTVHHCQFCEKAGCSGDCSAARRAFQLFRADVKQRASAAKKKAEAEAAKEE